ncbi:hypothetical protein EDD11_002381 [Mortierella claussenii]|nr:hypothetical protein EDD11_002381 [Mortierella claussenii]
MIRLIGTACVASIGLLSQRGVSAAPDSCPPCSIADGILKPCNSTLNILSWPGTFVYQPLENQAQCACNQNFYDQMLSCLDCQSSSSAKFTVKPLPEYKTICQSLGQATFPPVYIPGQSTTSSAAATPTDPSVTNPSTGHISTGAGHSGSGLSSGAVAGIIVSAIALIVALSVAGYVFARRRRELTKQREEDELYKYQEGSRNSYMEAPLPQYTGMIESSLPALPQLTNLRVMNPDNDDEEDRNNGARPPQDYGLDAPRTSSPGWRRGSFDDD